jgi:FG-GAP repeat
VRAVRVMSVMVFGLVVSMMGAARGAPTAEGAPSPGGAASLIGGIPSDWWGAGHQSLWAAQYGSRSHVSSPMTAPGRWAADGDQAGAYFGYSVAKAGDVNGDGYGDVIVGAPFYDRGQNDEGAASVYLGSANGLSTIPNWTAESGEGGARLGWSVGTAGDVNGDGYDDVVVGAPNYGQNAEGVAIVFHGSANGLSSTPAWTAQADQRSASFGFSVGTAGDINGDGYDDVIVGGQFYDNGQDDEGRAFVYHGSAIGLSTISNWIAESDQDHALFGYSVGTAGDVDGDGYADVIVGAPASNHGESAEGVAYVYQGSVTGLSTTPDWKAEGDQAGANLGASVGFAGDVDGDGYPDVITGARYYDHGEDDEGAVFVFRGRA